MKRLKSAKGKGTWDKIQEQPGTSIQVPDPSRVDRDMLSSPASVV